MLPEKFYTYKMVFFCIENFLKRRKKEMKEKHNFFPAADDNNNKVNALPEPTWPHPARIPAFEVMLPRPLLTYCKREMRETREKRRRKCKKNGKKRSLWRSHDPSWSSHGHHDVPLPPCVFTALQATWTEVRKRKRKTASWQFFFPSFKSNFCPCVCAHAFSKKGSPSALRWVSDLGEDDVGEAAGEAPVVRLDVEVLDHTVLDDGRVPLGADSTERGEVMGETHSLGEGGNGVSQQQDLWRRRNERRREGKGKIGFRQRKEKKKEGKPQEAHLVTDIGGIAPSLHNERI